ncbi:hypothetical protein [Galbibacter orientalis]|uniref:Sugar transporter n=1 Tax=Galbibacter orientalis DSM 19592 TaxID=926559 RepID=I3C814_9FLAO|nr:hypothetical protein [Galbibacter orientalis]EIJ39757.1 hypothetical protein JoomaDRAFT_2795 [Galbibacter orientalis DSM 19592]
MTRKAVLSLPIWFWIVSIFALIWNLMGLGAFIGQISMTQASLLALPISEKELLLSYPSWMEVVYAVAVLSGVIGSIGLLLRKKWSRPLFVLSLVAILIQMIYSLIGVTSLESFSPESVILPVFIILAGVFHVFFSNFSIKKNWLN